MEDKIFLTYFPVFVLIILSASIVAVAGLASQLVRPKNPSKLKETPYECGEEPVGVAWSLFNIRFYVIGLVFIIFDVEAALMFPVASVFKKFNDLHYGGVVLAETFLFVFILLGGLAYCWSKGDLDWVKTHKKSNTES